MYTCEHCGFSHGSQTYCTYKKRKVGDGCFQVDHKIPKKEGGGSGIRNAQVLCGTCNTSKGARNVSGRTGKEKYHGLDGKTTPKDYQRMPR